MPKKRSGSAETVSLKKRVKTEEPEPTPQPPKSDAERFAELEDELFGPEPPTEARASELSRAMFGDLDVVPPAAVMFEMRAACQGKDLVHEMMVRRHGQPRWLSRPFWVWLDTTKSTELQKFEHSARLCNWASDEMELTIATFSSMRFRKNPKVEELRQFLDSLPEEMPAVPPLKPVSGW